MKTRILSVLHGTNSSIMIEIQKIWFEGDWLFGQDSSGKIYKQSILWYRRLVDATEEQRNNYELSDEGMHWRCIDEDISFDSFIDRNGVEPTKMQKFFLSHREFNISGLAKVLGLSPSVLYDYINGWKIPSQQMVEDIRNGLLLYARNLEQVTF